MFNADKERNSAALFNKGRPDDFHMAGEIVPHIVSSSAFNLNKSDGSPDTPIFFTLVSFGSTDQPSRQFTFGTEPYNAAKLVEALCRCINIGGDYRARVTIERAPGDNLIEVQ